MLTGKKTGFMTGLAQMFSDGQTSADCPDGRPAGDKWKKEDSHELKITWSLLGRKSADHHWRCFPFFAATTWTRDKRCAYVKLQRRSTSGP